MWRGWSLLLAWLFLAVSLAPWPPAAAMRPDRVRDLRQETVQMFYHGFDNYMKVAFPEDEVWPDKQCPNLTWPDSLTCSP